MKATHYVMNASTGTMMLRKRMRDYVKSFMSVDGKFRISLIDSSDCLKTYINKFNLNPHSNIHDFKAINLMGQSMSASMLLSSLLKGEERIKLELFISNSNLINNFNNSNNNNNINNSNSNSNNLINHIHVESIQVGEIRGFVKFDQEEENDIFSVSRILMNESKPLTSSLPLLLDYNSEYSNLNSTFSDFFEKSEQIPTVTSLVCKQEFGLDPISYGIIIQKLPSIEDLSEELNNFKIKLNEMIKKINNRQDLHDNLFYNFIINEKEETVRFKPIDFYCRCSKQQFLNALQTINLNDLIEMRSEIINGQVEDFKSNCDYCNNTYHVDENDLNLLITSKR